MVGVKGEFENADTFEIASAIAAAVEKLGDVDLLIFGEGSADMYAQQTGVAAGAILGWPNVNAVSHLELEADGSLLVRRDTESCSETIRVKLPAVVSVTSDINRPRIPSMKDILAAGKKPVEVLDAAQLGLSSQAAAELVSIRAQEQKARACGCTRPRRTRRSMRSPRSQEADVRCKMVKKHECVVVAESREAAAGADGAGRGAVRQGRGHRRGRQVGPP